MTPVAPHMVSEVSYTGVVLCSTGAPSTAPATKSDI